MEKIYMKVFEQVDTPLIIADELGTPKLATIPTAEQIETIWFLLLMAEHINNKNKKSNP